MDFNLVKRQHYVWRRYLRAWTDKDDNIFVYFKNQNKALKTNLMNVGQVRFFYKMEVLDAKEFSLMKSFIESCGNKEVALYGFRLLELYRAYSELMIMKSQDPDVYKKCPDIEERLRDIEINTFEHLHGHTENLGNELLDCKTFDQLSHLIENNPYDSLFYIVIQYFRTKNMKENVVKGMKEKPVLSEMAGKVMPLIAYFMGIIFTYNAFGRGDYTFILVNNNSSVGFITGEQPVINPFDDDIDEQGEVKDLEFYYPISPQRAIIVQFAKEIQRVREISVAEDWVIQRNKLMWNHSPVQVYGDSNEIFEKTIEV